MIPRLFVGLALIVGLGVTATAGPARSSPHGQSGACSTCHAPVAKGGVPTFTQGSVDATCKTCHDYAHHQSGLVPARTRTPKGWPMEGDHISCATCHDEPACDGTPREKAPVAFFRGGPYNRIGELCAACHVVEGAKPYNPHRSIVVEADKAACNHCHLGPATAGGDLRVVSMNICMGCHEPDVHAGARIHLGPLPASMKAGVTRAGLPLTEDGSMGCITCHDPHPSGVLQHTGLRTNWIGKSAVPRTWEEEILRPAIEERASADPTLALEEPDFLWLPMHEGVLCQVCHRPSEIEEGDR